jgi:transposase-like protein
MVDHIGDSSEPRGRVDIQVGPRRRRRWSDEAKGRIVAESFAPGAIVSNFARPVERLPHLLEIRRLCAQLAHANRVATMGQLSASIAHEVNQPIAATLTNAQAALRWLAPYFSSPCPTRKRNS